MMLSDNPVDWPLDIQSDYESLVVEFLSKGLYEEEAQLCAELKLRAELSSYHYDNDKISPASGNGSAGLY